MDLNGRLLYRVELEPITLTPVFNMSSLNRLPDSSPVAPPCTDAQYSRANPRRWRQSGVDTIVVLSEECVVGLWELQWRGDAFHNVTAGIDLQKAVAEHTGAQLQFHEELFMTGAELHIDGGGKLYASLRQYANKSFGPAIAGSFIELEIERSGANPVFVIRRVVAVGTNPRHFLMREEGKLGTFVYVANQESSSVMRVSLDSFKVVEVLEAPINAQPAFILDLKVS